MESSESKFNSSAADFDAALARFSKLDTATTSKNPTYLLDASDDADDSVIDPYRFPKNLDPTFITPLPVSLQTNLFSVSWLVVLSKIFSQLSLTPQDTLVHFDCHDGRWLIEAALKKKCQCIGYGTDPSLQYKCESTASSQEVTDLVDYRLIDDVLNCDLSEATSIICSATQQKMSELRTKLETEVDPFTPIIIVGGEIVGWLPQWSTKHRGVPIYMYTNNGTDGVLGPSKIKEYRNFNEYTNPNDKIYTFSSGKSYVHLQKKSQ